MTEQSFDDQIGKAISAIRIKPINQSNESFIYRAKSELWSIAGRNLRAAHYKDNMDLTKIDYEPSREAIFLEYRRLVQSMMIEFKRHTLESEKRINNDGISEFYK